MHEPVDQAVPLRGCSFLVEDVRLRQYADNALLLVDDRQPGDSVLEHSSCNLLQWHVCGDCEDVRGHDVTDFHHSSFGFLWPSVTATGSWAIGEDAEPPAGFPQAHAVEVVLMPRSEPPL